MVQIKNEPKEEPYEIEVRYRVAETQQDGGYYQVESIRDQVHEVWGIDELEVKPKVEPIEIDVNRQPVVRLDNDFIRANFRPKWIELVETTYRRASINTACQLCEEVIEFKSASKLIEHYDEFHRKQITLYKCSLCEFSVKKTPEITDHWLKKHNNNPKNKNKYTEVRTTNGRNNIWIGDNELVRAFFGNGQQSSGTQPNQNSERATVRCGKDNPRIGHQQSHVECDVCLQQVKRAHLPRHKLIHEHRRPTFDCNICSEQFLSKYSLQMHEYRIHNLVQPKQFECDYCRKVFLRKSFLETHMTIHMKYNSFTPENSATQFKCEYCSKGFANRSYLHRHKFIHTKDTLSTDCTANQLPDKSYVECDICLKRVTTKHLPDHKLRHANQRPTFECKICDKVFNYKSNLKSHNRIIHTNMSKRQKFECNICSKSFLSRGSLTKHEYKTHHIVQPEQFECDYCQKLFQTKHGLETHINMHLKYNTFTRESKAKLYRCEYCLKSFSSFNEMKVHEFKVHIRDTLPNDDPRIKKWNSSFVECGFCSKKLQKQHLKVHRRTHTGERPFKCNPCDQSFATKVTLDKHKAMHNSGKLFDCAFCSLKLPSKSSLITHEMTHRKEDQYKCQFCNVTTATKGLFYAHIRSIHFCLLRQQDRLNGGLNEFFQDIRTYECYKCRYSTYFTTIIKIHLKACTIGSTFMKCPKCIMKFDSKKRMRMHFNRWHSTK